MKRLIVNADDFGLSPGVNRGVAESFRKGVLTSATLMANTPGFEDAVRIARNEKRLAVGVHLNIVRGTPVSGPSRLKTLTKPDNSFIGLTELFKRILLDRLDIEEVRTELRAQIKKVIGAGIRPTHFDSHRHFHSYPLLMEVVRDLCVEFGISRVRVTRYYGLRPGRLELKHRLIGLFGDKGAIRLAKGPIRSNDYFSNIFESVTADEFIRVMEEFVKGLPEGTTEIGCHPGYRDDITLEGEAGYAREKDIAFLTDPAFRECLIRHKVMLSTYGDI